MLTILSVVNDYFSSLGESTLSLPKTIISPSSSSTVGIFALVSLIPIIYFLFFTQSSTSPPKFSLLAPLFKGHFNFKVEGPLSVIREGYHKCGDIFRLHLFHQPVTVLIGPKAQKIFFEANDSVYRKKNVIRSQCQYLVKNIVYDAPTKIMMQQLKFVNKGLNNVNMQQHCGKIVKEAEEFFNAWPEEGEVDIMEQLSSLIIKTASRCLLGEEIRENVQEEFSKYYQQLSDGMSHLSFFFPHAPTTAHKKRDKARREISKIFSKVIQQRRLEPDQGSGLHDDFLQVLIDSRYTDGTQPDDEAIIGLLLAALFAGQHTSNITSTWMSFEIIQQKSTLMPRILEEQQKVLEKYDSQINLDSLSEMTLLHSCMKETLRMYPPLIILMRKALEPIQYKGYIIPKGDIVAVCPPVSHRLEEVFTNPNSFDPDRFSAERAEDTKQKFSFLAFGGVSHDILHNLKLLSNSQ